MAYFSRLILFFLPLLFCSSSWAATCTTAGYTCVPAKWSTYDYNNNALNGFDDSASAAAARISSLNSAPSGAYSFTLGAAGSIESSLQYFYFSSTYKSNGQPATTNGQFSVTAYCTSGDLLKDSGKLVCAVVKVSCSSGQVWDSVTNTCKSGCTAGTVGGAGSKWAWKGGAASFCNGGCQYYPDTSGYDKASGYSFGWGIATRTGESCTSGDTGGAGASSDAKPAGNEPANSDTDAPAPCGAGKCPGTVNGQRVCVACGSTSENKNSSGTSSGSNTTAPTTDSSGNTTPGSTSETGSTSENKTTKSTCSDGSCVTVTTTKTTNPDGSSGTVTTQKTESMSDFCAKNPQAVACKAASEGTWGGSCAGGFTCGGDAVQCAQAQASWKAACALDASGMTSQIADGSNAMSAGASSGVGLPSGGSTFNLSEKLSDVPLFGGSGGCPSDVTVSVGGRSYNLAFSSICPQLQTGGVALMAFAYLVAGFIVFRGDNK